MADDQVKIVVRDSDDLVLKIGAWNNPEVEGETNLMASQPPITAQAGFEISLTKYTVEGGWCSPIRCIS